MTRIGATARVEAAESFAQNSPSGLEYEAMKAVSGAASDVVRLSVQKASFQARITFKSMFGRVKGHGPCAGDSKDQANQCGADRQNDGVHGELEIVRPFLNLDIVFKRPVKGDEAWRNADGFKFAFETG